ncbi:MAG: SWIM zinc finger family protein [Planctomycetaceae bacterium]|nr:SWIM zinc finger family protein [Planctomycetaceae bacterium]MBV8266090.1 SWIM zinc finger family protein [Planctomycetaceae bacterium]MBV8384370.1 SWIM zinc finger family protein [Planctomycetaceae bacterium]MBV8606088.1 SWIM zinc finger family protein [Singulisphaera sp.]MBV8676774.1 SWIM zinc finger family protein [Planctomycetaceae bacterium]
MGWRYGYKPYVPVAKRRAQAAKEVAKRVKKGQAVSPVVIEGRAIVSTFWGKAWCTNLESYSDFENRLPRGRTYVRNGSVVDLKIEKGRIKALVSGSELYTVQIEIVALPQQAWQVVKELCAGKIGSLVELLQGKLSNAVMEAVTDRAEGLFPKPKEIKMHCSCPDYAGMCKHLAAVMYGIGNRLDSSPELLFELRGVDHQELIEQAIPAAPTRAKHGAPTIESAELGAIFDIEINDSPAAEPPNSKTTTKKAPKVKKAPAATKPATVKKAAEKKIAEVKKAAGKKTATVKKATAATKKKATKVSKKG